MARPVVLFRVLITRSPPLTHDASLQTKVQQNWRIMAEATIMW